MDEEEKKIGDEYTDEDDDEGLQPEAAQTSIY